MGSARVFQDSEESIKLKKLTEPGKLTKPESFFYAGPFCGKSAV